jgi:uncharacterized membrane protein
MQQETPRIPIIPQRLMLWVGIGLLLFVLTGWVMVTPEGLLGKADAIGYAVCHRITIRSFLFPDGRQLPLCARCTGTFLGVLVGMFGPALLLRRGRAALFPPLPILLVLIGLVAAWGFDGLNSYTFLWPPSLNLPHLYTPSNFLRIVTGMGQGIAFGSLILPVANSSLWADPAPTRTLENGWHLAILLGVGAAIIGMVLSGLAIFLYPLAILSALGVVTILGTIMTIMVVIFTRRDNLAHTLSDLLPPILWGLTLTFMMIGMIDVLRFLLTGVWDGGFIQPPV